MDKTTVTANTSFLDVDTNLDQVCLAGQAYEVDAITNRSVSYTYDSIGTISKATEKTVRADSTSARLRLVITELTDPPNPVPEYDRTITAACKVKASLLKEGAKDKVSLRCDGLGADFSAFPDLTPELIENIANARLKRVKADTEKGKLRISTAGVPANSVIPVSSCPPPTTTTTTTSTTTTTMAPS